jgi:hypothetical protein
MLFHYIGKTSEESYMNLYNSMDNKLYAAMLKRIPDAPSTYSEYLLLHQEKRPTAYKTFKKLHSETLRHIVLMYSIALAILVGASFFVPWFIVFPIFGLFHLAAATELRKDKLKHNKHFYLMMMHLTMLNEA